MNDEELLRNIKKIKNNLEGVKRNLRNARTILDQDLSINNDGFKTSDIITINNKITRQLNNINNKIIPKINNM